MRSRQSYCVVLLTILLTQFAALAESPRPVEQIKHAVVISIDGLRPDLLLRANTPALHGLFNIGAYSFWARTTEMSITLPSHTSMLTGVVPDKHGIKFNDDGPAEQVYPNVPTLLQLAKKAGYTIALAAAKSKFAALAKDVDWVKIPERKHTALDADVAQAGVSLLKEHHPDVLFVHFGSVDLTGHQLGWATPQQVAVIEKVDACVAEVIKALQELKLIDSTLIIVSADHGGTGRWHGPDDARARHIPWIAVGPGIRKGYDLTCIKELVINTEDTFATTCWLLNIPVDHPIDGKPVRQILDKPQLLYESPAIKPSAAN